jgi:MYXO-CTERM domain-containing protein
MLRFTQKVLFAVLLAVIAGCSGGGCSSGCSCGGVTPLAAGFPTERRIENVGSVRITESGLDFLEQNAGALVGLVLGDQGGIFSFEIPNISDSLGFGTSYNVCPNGPKPNSTPPECVAEFDLANTPFQIDAQGPHNLHIHGPLHLRIQKLPISYTLVFVPGSLDLVINKPGSCPGTNQPFAEIDLSVNISLEIDGDASHARFGYSQIKVASISINKDQVLNQIEYCNGGLGGALIDAVDGFLFDFLEDSLTDALVGAVEDAMCQQANPELDPPCPLGTTNVDGVCRYGTNSDAQCATIILGMEGNFDLGGLLAGFSPGTKGAFDFLFAAGGHSLRPDGTGHHFGDLNPINGGATLSLYGGTDPTPVSGCVTPVDVDLPAGIPVPDELTANTIPDWPANTAGPHFGIAISERFTNYMLAQLYNSGALCLGVTADALGPSVPLTTSIVGLGVGAASLTELGRQGDPAPLALIIRPGQPPHAEFGKGTDPVTDPLIHLTMNQVSIDFYAWSLDRYIRAMTLTMDLDIPVNLEAGPEGLTPVIADIGVANSTVTNHEKLIREDPVKIAAAVQDLLGSLVGGALGDALPAVDLASLTESLGLALVIPPSVPGQGSPGLTKITKDGDDFLGIFATLELAMAMNLVEPEFSQTSASLRSFEVDPAGLAFETRTDHNGPRAIVDLGSNLDDGTRTMEWQYRLNNEVWKPFTRSRSVVIDDGVLRFPGKHQVFVRSRVAGQPKSLDREPVVIDLLVDEDAPSLRVTESPIGEIMIHANDVVSGASATKVRFRLMYDGTWGAWSEWLSAATIPTVVDERAEEIEVEAQDEKGHIATVQQAIIRGRADGAGCECSLGPASPASPSRSGGWLLLALAGLALTRRRRATPRIAPRAKSWLAAIGLIAFGGLSGCSCGDEVTEVPAACRDRGDCDVLRPGLVGSYTSVVVAPDGRVWVAGYLEKDWEDDWTYGDLVVGTWANGETAWKVVDGVPNDPVNENLYDPKGFRGGQTEAGDDVGLWTSIAIGPNGQPAVAYFDATNRALKYASLGGGGWAVTTVQQLAPGDAGRYAKLTFVGGAPTIAFLFIEPGELGAVNSGVRLATGSSADAGGATWAFEDVYRDLSTPCRADLCPTGTECVLEGGLCAEKSSDCPDKCPSGQACVLEGGTPICRDKGGPLSIYPDAVGLYIDVDLRPDGGLGVAWYDRVHGNVMVAQKDAMGGWASIIVDGQDAAGNDTGDKGIGLSLDVDGAGNFHLSYVDGLSESVNYALVEGGVNVVSIEVVDDGFGAGDGTHIVGDDSDILVTPSGEIHVSYQDATAGTLQYAVGTPSATGHTWNVRTVAQDEFAGAFSEIVTIGGSQQVLNWWRVASPQAKGGVRILAP